MLENTIHRASPAQWAESDECLGTHRQLYLPQPQDCWMTPLIQFSLWPFSNPWKTGFLLFTNKSTQNPVWLFIVTKIVKTKPAAHSKKPMKAANERSAHVENVFTAPPPVTTRHFYRKQKAGNNRRRKHMEWCCSNYHTRVNMFLMLQLQVRVSLQSNAPPLQTYQIHRPKSGAQLRMQTVVMMSFAVLSQTEQHCGSSSSPKTSRSSWAVFQSQSHSDMAAPAPPIKIRRFIWTMCPPGWWALTPQVCCWHLPLLAREGQPNDLGFARDFKTFLFPFHLSRTWNHQGSAICMTSHYMWSHASEIWADRPCGFCGKQVQDGIADLKTNRIHWFNWKLSKLEGSDK